MALSGVVRTFQWAAFPQAGPLRVGLQSAAVTGQWQRPVPVDADSVARLDPQYVANYSSVLRTPKQEATSSDVAPASAVAWPSSHAC